MGGSRKLSHELLAHLGSYMHCRYPALRKIPKEMLEMPFLDMMGMVDEPYHRAVTKKLVEGLVEEPTGQHTESRLANLAEFAKRAGKEDLKLLMGTVNRILLLVERLEDPDSKQRMAGEVAEFLIRYHSALGEDIRAEVAAGTREMLLEISPLTRNKIIELLGSSVCDFSSDGSRMPALDLIQPTREELLTLFRRVPEKVEKTLKCLVDDALRDSFLSENVHGVVTVLAEALKGTQQKESAKIALAYVNIYCEIEDFDLKMEIRQMMSEALVGHGEMLRKLLPQFRKNENFDAMLTIAEPHLSYEERTEIIKTRIGEHIAIFESDPESENADSHLGRIVELGHMGGPECVSYAASKIEPDGKASGKLADILAWSVCDETSDDKEDLVIFDMISGEKDLLHVYENAESEYIRKIAAERLEMRKQEDAQTLENRRKERFRGLMHDAAESDEAKNILSKLIEHTFVFPDPRSGIHWSTSYLLPSMHTASQEGKRKIIMALADIYLRIDDDRLKAEFKAMVGEALRMETELVKNIILGSMEDESRQLALFKIVNHVFSKSDIKEVLYVVRKYRIDGLMLAFERDPESAGAERLMTQVADIATSNNLGNEVMLYTLETLIECARTAEKRDMEDIAFERVANCIIGISAALKDEYRKDALAFTVDSDLPPRLRERMLKILELSNCKETSVDKLDLIVFDLVHFHTPELSHLAENARSEYVKRLAKEKIDAEVAFMEETREGKQKALYDSVQEYRKINGMDKSIAEILYDASNLRANLENYAWPEGAEWPTERIPDKKPDGDMDENFGELAAEAIKKARPPAPNRILSELSRAAIKVETRFAKLDDIDRSVVMQDMIADCTKRFMDNPSDIDNAKKNIAILVSLAGEWKQEDAPIAFAIIDGIIGPVEKIGAKDERVTIAVMAAKALLEITENSGKNAKDMLVTHATRALAEKGRNIRNVLVGSLIHDRFEENTERAKLLFSLVSPSSKELEFVLNNANCPMVISMAREMRANEKLDENERFMVESILRIANGFSSIPEKMMVEGFLNMETGLRYVRARSAITSLMYDADKNVAVDWKKRIMAAEKAVHGLYRKLGLDEPFPIQKRNAVIKNPDLLTQKQRELICDILGITNMAELRPEDLAKLHEHINDKKNEKERGKKSIRKWLRRNSDLLRLASMLHTNMVTPLDISRISEEEKFMISWAMGKMPSDVTDEDVSNLLDGLVSKDKSAFGLLTHSEIEPSLENFRKIGARMREARDLLDFFGEQELPAKIAKNRDGIWSSEQDLHFSYVLDKRNETALRVDAIFEGTHVGDGESGKMAKEVFDLGIHCGLLENMQDAIILSCVADLIVASRNYGELAKGKLKNLRDGRGTSLSLTIQDGNSLETLHIGPGKWAILRNGSIMKNSANGFNPTSQDVVPKKEKGVLRRARKIVQSLMGKPKGKKTEHTDSVSMHFESIGGSGAGKTGIGRLMEFNIGEFELLPGDVIALYSSEVADAVPEQTITQTLSGEEVGPAVERMGRSVAEKSRSNDFSVIAFKHGGRKG